MGPGQADHTFTPARPSYADCHNESRFCMHATHFERITVNPNQMDGVPCIRALRIPVATVLRMLAGGMTEKEILADYPDFRVTTFASAYGSRRLAEPGD